MPGYVRVRFGRKRQRLPVVSGFVALSACDAVDRVRLRFLRSGGCLCYPLGHGDRSLIGQKVFSDLAAKYGKSNAQIILRWHVQMGHIVIPGSKNPGHIASNFYIFDFALTADEMKSIAKLDRNKRYYNMSLKGAAKAYLSLDLDFDDQP